MTDEELLALAVAEAQVGLSEGGIPIGAALAHGDRLASRSRAVRWISRWSSERWKRMRLRPSPRAAGP